MVKKKSNSENSSESLVKVIDTERLISVDHGIPPLLNSGKLSTLGTLNYQKLQILVNSDAFLKINTHIQSDMSHEVGGFLIGRPYESDGKKYVEVVDAVAAEAVSSSAVHLTFSSDTWVHAKALLRDKFPGVYIVGWYHTHPRMPLFLSTQDLAIHEGFFRESWHVALVLDPTRQDASFFIWDESQIREASGFQVLFPPEYSEKEHWHIPDVSSRTISKDVVLEDFYEAGCWISRWMDDEYIVKLQGDEVRKLRQKLQKAKLPQANIQVGFCIGKEIRNKLKEKPFHLVDVRVLYSSFADRQSDQTILWETIQGELKKAMTKTMYQDSGLHVMGLYILASALPQRFLKQFIDSLSKQYKFLLTCDVLANKYSCYWRKPEGELVEREMVEVINLSEISEAQLVDILHAVKDAYNDIKP